MQPKQVGKIADRARSSARMRRSRRRQKAGLKANNSAPKKLKDSGCYCVICLAEVPEAEFIQRNGCCSQHTFDMECTYT